MIDCKECCLDAGAHCTQLTCMGKIVGMAHKCALMVVENFLDGTRIKADPTEHAYGDVLGKISFSPEHPAWSSLMDAAPRD